LIQRAAPHHGFVIARVLVKLDEETRNEAAAVAEVDRAVQVAVRAQGDALEEEVGSGGSRERAPHRGDILERVVCGDVRGGAQLVQDAGVLGASAVRPDASGSQVRGRPVFAAGVDGDGVDADIRKAGAGSSGASCVCEVERFDR
jgi:hypothetical protein